MNERQKNAETLKKIPPPPADAVFSLRKIDTVVIPHPYVIGKKHLEHSHGGTIDTTLPCDSCGKPASDHVSQKTLFIRVPQNRDLNAVPGLHQYLLSIKEPATALGVEGFAFPDKDPRKIRAWIAATGQGCFMCPPSHPDHFKHLEYRDGGSGSVALSSVIEDEDGYYSEHLEEHLLEEIRQTFAKWENTKPAIDNPRTVAWMTHVYAHLNHCYKDDKAEAEPFEYGKPATLIFPVPSYKLRQFHDDHRFSDTWRENEVRQINLANDEIRAKYAKVCTPDNHAAVRFIREYYPEHTPRLDWIAQAPKNPGSWYETLEAPPKPEDCPGDVKVKIKHPVNGSWCQFCGWYEEKKPVEV
jgi:hypothetical protein